MQNQWHVSDPGGAAGCAHKPLRPFCGWGLLQLEPGAVKPFEQNYDTHFLFRVLGGAIELQRRGGETAVHGSALWRYICGAPVEHLQHTQRVQRGMGGALLHPIIAQPWQGRRPCWKRDSQRHVAGDGEPKIIVGQHTAALGRWLGDGKENEKPRVYIILFRNINRTRVLFALSTERGIVGRSSVSRKAIVRTSLWLNARHNAERRGANSATCDEMTKKAKSAPSQTRLR